MTAKKQSVKNILAHSSDLVDKEVELSGWVRTVRQSKTFGFIGFNDGSCFKNFQIVFDDTLDNFEAVSKLLVGSALTIQGTVVESQGKGQALEVQAKSIEIVGASSADNPIQKKRHSFEFLRTKAHLRSRTNTFLAVFRVRSLIAHSIHQFFQNRNFVYVHTPIITSADAEGAGEIFKVSSLDFNQLPLQDGKVDFSQELLGRDTFLTVSGQLAVEPFCMAYKNVYTFGPTFRAENSNTARHASEFWMIEPEIAFANLEDTMDLAEEMMKHLIEDVLEKAPDEIEFFNKFIDKGLLDRLNNVLNSTFERITYTKAVELLEKSGQSFEYPIEWGSNLQTEHERYLSEDVFKKPVFVTDYPKDIKAFYMRQNDDNKTVGAMDLLVPGVGEIIGGSEREERPEILAQKFKEFGIEEEEYDWYMDIRKFGTFPHAGYGLGFERAVMYLTGMKNIRDVIPYPVTPNNAAF